MIRYLGKCVFGLTTQMLSVAAMAFTPVAGSRTVTGVVDGQKYGTNILGDGVLLTFESDSAEESQLLEACNAGARCKVVVISSKGNTVTRLISAKPVLAVGKSGSP